MLVSRIADDIRFALRTFRKAPAFTAGAILTIALGIGANVTNFKTINAVLLRPNPGLKDPERLVRLNEATAEQPAASDVSYRNYRMYRRAARSFSGLTASALTVGILGGAGAARRTDIELVADNYFAVLGIAPVLGRGFTEEEVSRPGEAAVAVISHGLWERRFGRDPRILQRSMRLNGREYPVIGVAPPRFRGFELFAATEVWIPVTMAREFATGIGGTNLLEDPARLMGVIGRLAPGVTRDQAQAELQTIAGGIAAAEPVHNKSLSVLLSRGISMAAEWRSNVERLILAVSVLVGVLLLLVTANLTNLLLARAADRRAEIAVRLSLGASRGAIASQLLTESLVLASLGGAAAIAFAEWASAYTTRITGDLPFEADTDATVLVFTAGVVVLTGVVMGILPALRASRADLNSGLRGGSSGAAGSQTIRNALVAAQVTLAIALLGVCGMAVRSLVNANRTDFGFPVRNLLMAEIDLRSRGYSEPQARVFYDRVLRQLREIPGVRAAALADTGPVSAWLQTANVRAEGKRVSPGQHTVGADYFRTVGIAILNGREFIPADAVAGMPVCVVNESLARYVWGSSDVTGRTLELEHEPGRPKRVFVVGVAKDVIHGEVTRGPRPWLYLPVSQHHEANLVVHVAAEDSAAMRAAIQKTVNGLDAELPETAVRNVGEILRDVFFRTTSHGVEFGGVRRDCAAAGGAGGVLGGSVLGGAEDSRVRCPHRARRDCGRHRPPRASAGGRYPGICGSGRNGGVCRRRSDCPILAGGREPGKRRGCGWRRPADRGGDTAGGVRAGPACDAGRSGRGAAV
jgi:predicted permease